ncbi:hypothetical protein [Streptomyces rubiginosohelvolus]|uniref:hypothetical protein n=1 Tax=Streptomyces rubiginosohelvolus TaxID=67362 RepID=UPI0037FDE5BB
MKQGSGITAFQRGAQRVAHPSRMRPPSTALRETITRFDETPFASEDGEWSKFFEEIALGMWG